MNTAAIRTTRDSGFQKKIWRPPWQPQHSYPRAEEEAAVDSAEVSVADSVVDSVVDRREAAEPPDDGENSLLKATRESFFPEPYAAPLIGKLHRDGLGKPVMFRLDIMEHPLPFCITPFDIIDCRKCG